MMLSIWYIFLIIPIGIFYIFLSYLFSIDWQNSYQKVNSEFPNFSETQSSQLLIANIKINDLIFRLRILNPKASGDTIILLHGFPQTSISWEPVFDSFKNSDYKVLQDGMNQLPPANEEIRLEIDHKAEKIGWPEMHIELEQVDPVSAKEIKYLLCFLLQ